MKVTTILQDKGHAVVSTRPDRKVGAVIARLNAEHIGAMIVMEDDKIVGIVSERDIVRAMAAHRGEVMELAVHEIMSSSVITCTPEDTIKKVMQVMTERRVRHLPVLDGGALAGIISIGDVVKNRLENLELEASVLRDAYIARR